MKKKPEPMQVPQPAGGLLQVLSCEAAQLPAGFTPPLARVAQYPDSQQLQLWLPEEAKPEDWQRLRLRDTSGRMLLDEPVQALLLARTRLLLDALPWPAGELWLEIGHAAGGCVRVQLMKDAAEPVALPQPAALADAGEDLQRRDAQRQQLARRFARRLSYTNQGRAGLVHYHEGDELSLSFPWEMSGDDAEPLWIDVPTVQDWERVTGVPLQRREEILRFVAETACREQSSSWTAELREGAIVFLAGR
jgi:hypothetical protein